MLACHNLIIEYGGERVLDRASVTVKPGSVTALIGPSGAGKSTLLRSMAFLESPTAGQIEIDGKITKCPLPHGTRPKGPWPLVTAVFQQLFLWPHLTLRDNIMLPLRLSPHPPEPATAESLIRTFDMSDFVDRFPNEVSGGQRQRAALVRALALRPRYLLLDEITSALDIEQAAAIVAHLADLKNSGIGILLVTHFLGFVRRTADHVVFLDKGQIEEAGAPSILKSPQSPRFRRFLEAQSFLDDGSRHREVKT